MRIARLIEPQLKSIGSFRLDGFGKIGIKRLQHLSPERKIGGKLSGSACRSHGGIEKFATLLRLPVNEIHGASIIGTTSIVGGVVVREFLCDVVAVVGNLVVEFTLLRVHFIEPIKPPINFIHDIRNAIGALQSIGLIGIGERLRVLPEGEHHLIDGISRCGSVLQQIGCIVPAAPHIKVLPLLRGMIANKTILLVATIGYKRIKAASLLTHVIEHKIGGAIVDIDIDRENGRNSAIRLDLIGTRSGKLREIEAESGRHIAQFAHRLHFRRSEHHLSGKRIHQLKRSDLNRLFADEHRHFRRLRQIAQLIDSQPRISSHR